MSQLLKYFEKHLPTPLRELDARDHDLLSQHLSAFLVPMEDIHRESESMKQQIGTEFGDFYSFIIGSVLGISGFTLNSLSQKRLLPRLAEFIRERGTRRGLEILVECFFETKDFQISEQSYPFTPLRLAIDSAEERLSSDIEGPLSITINFEQLRTEFDAKIIADFQEIVVHELAPDTTVYLRFKENISVSDNGMDYGPLGEENLQ